MRRVGTADLVLNQKQGLCGWRVYFLKEVTIDPQYGVLEYEWFISPVISTLFESREDVDSVKIFFCIGIVD